MIFLVTDEQEKLILGGEACLWSEYVDKTNILARIFPFVGAVAERLWSTGIPIDALTADQARNRLHQHRCRILRLFFFTSFLIFITKVNII